MDWTTAGPTTVVIAIIVPMMWFMLRELRAAINGIAREMSDLTLTIALDVATRPYTNEAVKKMAETLASDHERRSRS